MKEGNIVLVALPQSDGKVKKRPALLLKKMPPFNDWLPCGISTQVHHNVPEFDQLIEETTDYFTDTVLQKTSLIRLGFLAVVPTSQISGGIGQIPDPMVKELIQRLCNYILS